MRRGLKKLPSTGRLNHLFLICFFVVGCNERIILDPTTVKEMLSNHILSDSTYDVKSLNNEYKELGEFKFIKNKLDSSEVFLFLKSGDIIYVKNDEEIFYTKKVEPYYVH